jgi:hypothetical protein
MSIFDFSGFAAETAQLKSVLLNFEIFAWREDYGLANAGLLTAAWTGHEKRWPVLRGAVAAA